MLFTAAQPSDATPSERSYTVVTSTGSGKTGQWLALFDRFTASLSLTRAEIDTYSKCSGGVDLILELGRQLVLVEAKSHTTPRQNRTTPDASPFGVRRSLDFEPSPRALPDSQVLNPASENADAFHAGYVVHADTGTADLVLLEEAHTAIPVAPLPRTVVNASELTRGIDLVRSTFALIDERATRFAPVLTRVPAPAASGYVPWALTCGHYGLAVPLIPRAPGDLAPGLHTRPGRDSGTGAPAGGAAAA
ncbi:hypothetical protein [Streptomyces sp. NPDC001665]